MRSIRAAGSDDGGHAASTTLTTLTRLTVVRDVRPRLKLLTPAPATLQLMLRGTPHAGLDVLATVCPTPVSYTHLTLPTILRV